MLLKQKIPMLIRVMKNNTTFAIIAITAVTALLIATTAVSSLTNQAFASKSSHQTAAQSCINENVRCQNIQNQLQGQDNAGTVVGNQPLRAAMG
jgi:PhoPQ-activated pathogenicity-related protein